MRKVFLAALMALWSGGAFAQGAVSSSAAPAYGPGFNPLSQDLTGNLRTATSPATLVPLGYCSLSVGNSAVTLASCSGGIPTGSRVIYVTPETAAVRWRDDGTNPTASVGYPVQANGQLTYSGTLSAIAFIAQSGTATVDVAFYK